MWRSSSATTPTETVIAIRGCEYATFDRKQGRKLHRLVDHEHDAKNGGNDQPER